MSEVDGTSTQLQALERVPFNTKALLLCLRPKQWIKNGLVLAPLVFSGELLIMDHMLKATAGAAIFCMLSGGLYVVNDLLDLERDKLHPEKSKRPLAAGKVPLAAAVWLAAGMIIAALLASYGLGTLFAIASSLYAANVLAYSLWLKHVVILDVFSISSGFVLRAVAGALAIGVKVSPWLVICTICLSLFLALTKRRAELLALQGKSGRHRQTLEQYSPALLDKMIGLVTPSTLMCYSLYAITGSTTPLLMYTIPLVLFGLLRYLYLVERKDITGTPESALFTDFPLLLTVLIWGLSTIGIIYLG
jgi:4-hydroxybenzoate polyprenyltransferase